MDATVREFIKSTYQSLTGSVKGSLKDAWRIDGLGLLSISILVVLAIYIYINSRCETCGFENPPIAKTKAKAVQYTGISDLPEAPQNNLADVNSLPYQDPAMAKGSTEMLRQLKQDMDGFSTFELEKMPDVSDPAVKLPITQFKGDYQRVKDELMVVNRTPGVQTSLSVQKINEMAANLRFLQRTYRTYANNELVPQPQTPMTQVGASETVEGFFAAKGNGEACSRSTECSSGNCNKSVNPHVCSDPQDPSTITGGSYTSSGDLNSVPQVCYGTAGQTPNLNLGSPAPGNGLRLYTKTECETNLGGVWQDNGVCHESRNLDGSFPPISGSWSVMCRNMNPASGSASTVASGSSITTAIGTTTATPSTITATPVTDPSSLYNSYLSWMNSSSYGTTSTVDTVSPSTTVGSNVASNVTPVITDTPTHTGDPNYARITRTQLDLLVQKIAVEITRLQASGTTDPIVRSRVNIFLRIKQSLTDIQRALDAGTMKPQDIPILVKDYNNFLPAIGSTNTGIAGLLSQSGYPTLASLFNAFSQGDITNSEINNHLLHSYARALINGLSYKFDISYTSANEVEARKAEAIKAAYDSGDTAADIGMQMKMHTGHPRTMHGSRGAFDSHVRQMDLNGFERDSQGYSRPSSSASAGGQGAEGSGGFDWKGRAEKIFDNVKRAGMNPYDYGMDEDVYANAINSDFSWRGYTKMVCSRLATNAEQGMAEKMGCPPASWIGWRS